MKKEGSKFCSRKDVEDCEKCPYKSSCPIWKEKKKKEGWLKKTSE